VSEIWWSLEPGEIEIDDERTITHDPFNGSARSKRGWQVRGTLDTFPTGVKMSWQDRKTRAASSCAYL